MLIYSKLHSESWDYLYESLDMKNFFAWLIRLLASSSNRYDEDDVDGKENENNLDRNQLKKAKKKQQL